MTIFVTGDPPEKPSTADWEAYGRVVAWMNWAGHQVNIAQGRYELHMASDEPMMIVTDYGSEIPSPERMVELGMTPITDGNGVVVGWSHTL